jgi:hypothetical protein
MADWRNLAAYYRSPDRADYPELQGYTRDEIYEDCIGGGALYLAARMARIGPMAMLSTATPRRMLSNNAVVIMRQTQQTR